MIDPGLEGDLYADKPHLYGRALSSFNVISVGERVAKGEGLRKEEGHGDRVVEEGGKGEGLEWRKSRDVPDDAGKRKAWFLAKAKAERWQWEEGRVYEGDFFNPYLDFNDFSLKLPGFSLSVLGYLGGEDYLRWAEHPYPPSSRSCRLRADSRQGTCSRTSRQETCFSSWSSRCYTRRTLTKRMRRIRPTKVTPSRRVRPVRGTRAKALFSLKPAILTDDGV